MGGNKFDNKCDILNKPEGGSSIIKLKYGVILCQTSVEKWIFIILTELQFYHSGAVELNF